MIKKYIKNILFPFIGPTYTRLKIELEEIKKRNVTTFVNYKNLRRSL